jgi:hypothetical protein
MDIAGVSIWMSTICNVMIHVLLLYSYKIFLLNNVILQDCVTQPTESDLEYPPFDFV